MKIYRRKEFMTLPAGTIYAKGKPWYFDGFTVKGDTICTVDWATLGPVWIDSQDSGEAFDRLQTMLDDGASFPMNEDYGRDGCFDDDEIFLVFEKDDLVKLRALIDNAIKVAK